MDFFEKASRIKLRFDLNGQISVEHLWNASMSALADYEQQLTETVESYGKSTRRSKKTRTEQQELNQLRLEIVTYILDVREEELEVAKNAANVKEHNQKILELIRNKQDQKLQEMSVEELEKLLKS